MNYELHEDEWRRFQSNSKIQHTRGGGVERERRREVEIEKVPHRCNLKRGRNEAPPGYYILPFLWNIISLPLMRKMAENNPGFRPTAKIYFMLGQSTENK